MNLKFEKKMYTNQEIEIILFSCNTWAELQKVCSAFDYLIKNGWINIDSAEKEFIRITALKVFTNLENQD